MTGPTVRVSWPVVVLSAVIGAVVVALAVLGQLGGDVALFVVSNLVALLVPSPAKVRLSDGAGR